jgi:glycosyltransferase involved in cell wall biosynthesis
MYSEIVSHRLLFSNFLDDDKALIDIIIPVFNTERYVIRAVESAIDGYSNRHIILVDDCSTDYSQKKILDYCKDRAENITVIAHDVNRGLSQSRNTALKYVRSNLICFLDSDDMHNSGILEVGIHIMRANQEMEILQFKGMHFDNQRYNLWPFGSAYLYDQIGNLEFSTEVPSSRLINAEPNAALKILRKNFVQREQLEFPVGKKFEDYHFHTQAIIRAKKPGIFNGVLLFQRMGRGGEQITSSRDDSRMDVLDVIESALSELDQINDSIASQEFLKLAIRSVNWCGKMIPAQSLDKFCDRLFQVFSSQTRHFSAMNLPEHSLSFSENISLMALQNGSKKLWLDAISRTPTLTLFWAVARFSLKSGGIQKVRTSLRV